MKMMLLLRPSSIFSSSSTFFSSSLCCSSRARAPAPARVSHLPFSGCRSMSEKQQSATNNNNNNRSENIITASSSSLSADGEVVVQYVVLRRDLIDTWPVGSIVTHGCHASVSAVWAHRHHPDTAAYVSDSSIDSMHKVTLEVKGETQLRNFSEKLEEGGIDHQLWMEQPENIATCIATRLYPKSQVAPFFKKLKLCK